MKRNFTFTLFLIFSFIQHIYSQNNGHIKGKLFDLSTKKAIPLSTITVFKASDTSIISYRLTNDNGEFSIPLLPLNMPLRLMITHVGYKIIRKEFVLASDKNEIQFGNIQMEKDTASLTEVILKSEIPPVIFRNDTIEFNASSFKTLPNALVEDLLKKLPGVVVNRDGDITYNGRKVSKIYVDGREFFGTDPKIASRNLPANIIDKVQVTEDLDTKYLNPNAQDWELAQVINLKFKKEIKKGWFGKVFGGYGTNDQYETGGVLNTFRDTLQLSFIGFANNVNKTGFSSKDLVSIGGFGRSGFNNLNTNGMGGISIDGVSFGGGLNGLNKSAGLGTNINTLIGKKSTFNLQYFYGNEQQILNKDSRTDQSLKDSSLNTINKNTSILNANSHQLSVSTRKNYSATASLSIKASVKYIIGDNTSNGNISTSLNNTKLINESTNKQDQQNNQWEYSHEILYNNFRLKKTGQILRVSNNLYISNGLNKQYNNSYTLYYSQPTSAVAYDQLRRIDQPSSTSKTNLTFITPLSNSVKFVATEALENFSTNQGLATLNKDLASNDYVLKIDSLSGELKKTGFKSLTSSAFSWNISKSIAINFGANWQWIHIQNKFINNAMIPLNYHFVFPTFRFQIRRNVLNYTAKGVEPQTEDLQPLANISNPLFITQGNINLKPYTVHTLSFTTGQYDGRKPLTYNIGFTYNLLKDAIINSRTIENGIQYSKPINVNGTSSISLYGGLSDRIKLDKDWNLLFRLSNINTYYQNAFIINNIKNQSKALINSGSIEFNFNWKDKIEFYPKYSLTVNTTTYNDPKLPKTSYLAHRIENGVVLRLINHVVFESSLDYQYNPQVPAGIKKSNTLLNAAINYVFMKDDRGVLKLSGFDLLNENTGISRNITENFIQVTQIQLIRQYFLMTFTYNIRKFGTKNVGGKEGLFRL